MPPKKKMKGAKLLYSPSAYLLDAPPISDLNFFLTREIHEADKTLYYHKNKVNRLQIKVDRSEYL